ncbi:substrate-binding domain-containing protein [Grimontia sp. NTOU-MAR1]|uniref:substrate-binding domain-containing protein n=1 Tax=Grimontia sp. NTOU-MAR1 TaxID=3111011 RepID=UPI002DBBF003|nr:substrate-binding domain-containing protein [Grimontia sp. NTOU-MAR1]WRW00641.1 substrate-binding domain-containing protein [Grimontia sp. NTOU-MAR1]
MATIKDVARHAGVSVATVSRVINGSQLTKPDTADLVKRTMRELGYRPNAAARTLVSKRSLAIGVVVADVSDPFFGSLVKYVDNVAHKQGHHLLIGNGYHEAAREKQAIESLIQNQVTALIVHSKALDNDTLRAYAQEHGAMVFINRLIPGLEDRCIYLDNYHGAFLATEHLIEQGHRYVAYIGSSHAIEDTEQRQQGYEDALNTCRVTDETHPVMMAFDTPEETGGERAMAALMEENDSLSAVFCYNDVMAAGAITALTDLGYRVPEDVSVVGFDDSLIARYLHPKLTSVRYPIEEMAELAAEQAIALSTKQPMRNEKGSYAPTLIKRNSVTKSSE